MNHLTSVGNKADKPMQQLLANWRRARGKERDALLWGDEVRATDPTSPPTS
jgi:glutamate--cysteine ligase catalytic subunit